ncbi:MAG: hypothetical protein F6K42_04560 [Leptolyngbya sp. SIO1D8]|nr:hypothetical protein [Leptolyngbya sp. SIO1D8]
MTKVSLHRFAGFPRRFLVALGLGVGLLTIGAIAPLPSPTQDTDTSTSTPQDTATQSTAQPTLESVDQSYQDLSTTLNAADTFWETAKTNSPELMSVMIYTPTATCDGFQTQEQAIAADKAIPQIVQLLLADQTPHLLDFELAGYRIQPGDEGNSITVDFRRVADAQRHFTSLSICEQLVLFGSLRKTLLENPALNVDSVSFTEKGRMIQL